jgi:hypothetical protein
LQSCRKEEVGKFWPLLAIAPPNHQNHANPNFIELFWSQNHTDSKTRFLKGVALDGTQKARAVCDL